MFTPSEVSEEKSETVRIILENTVKLTQACNEFAKANPTLSKYGGMVLEYAGCALGAMALCSAAQVGAVPLLITGSSMAAQNELFAVVVENGAEALVDKAASYGRTEAESLKFADGALKAVEIGLNGVATVGLIKGIKNGAALRAKCIELRTNLKQRVRDVFKRTQTNNEKIDLVSSKGLYDALDKGTISCVASRFPTRYDIIKESEMVQKAAAMPGEWKGQFKLIKEIPQTTSGTEFESEVYCRQVLFKDPKSGQMFRAFQRNDIDPNYVGKLDKFGNPLSNLELMKKGRAPYTNSGEPVIIHHMGQDGFGPFVEVTKTTHKLFLHNQYGYGQPHPTNPVIRSEFNPIREAYWRAYAEQFK